jgi:hypothetical protein
VAPSPDLENRIVGQTNNGKITVVAGVKVDRLAAGQPAARRTAPPAITITVKIVRAYGGCLGTRSRRRAWTAAISRGEPLNGL